MASRLEAISREPTARCFELDCVFAALEPAPERRLHQPGSALGFSDPARRKPKKKRGPLHGAAFLGINPQSGEGEIRTPGTLRYAGFQDRCNRPLCHLSESRDAFIASSAIKTKHSRQIAERLLTWRRIDNRWVPATTCICFTPGNNPLLASSFYRCDMGCRGVTAQSV